MPKDFTAPSQQWNIKDQINQSRTYNQQDNKNLDDYKKKTQALITLDKNLSNLEANGYDTTEDRKYYDTKSKEMELGFGEKLGVVGRNLGNDYVSSFSKAFGGNLDKSYSDKLDEAKQKREEIINPVSTIATEVALDPLTYTPLSFASKGTKAVRMAKDFGKGAGLSAGLYTAKEYGDDNYKASDSAIAGAFGGGLNALLGRVLNRNISGNLTNPDATSGENITNRILFEQNKLKPDVVAAPTQPIGDEVVQENIIKPNNNQDDIAAKINQTYFGGTQPEVAKVNIPEANNGINSQQVNDFFNPIDKNIVQAQGNKNLPTPASQQDPFVYNPNKQVDTFGFVKDAEKNSEITQVKQNNLLPSSNPVEPRKTDSGIYYSNGTQTFGGGAVGGMESEFNQRDYNNDGKHDYKDNIYGAIVGAIGVNAAKKLFPKAFKDGNIDANTNGMFVGANPAEQGAFSDVATKKVMREIDDSRFKFNQKPLFDAMNNQYNKFTWLDEVVEHPTLFEKYPQFKDVKIMYDDKLGLNGGSFDGNIIRVSSKGDIASTKSTILHEIQHAIQKKEDWARGGNPKQFEKTPLDAKKGEYANYILSESKTNEEAKKIINEIKDDALKNIDDPLYTSDDLEVIIQLSKSDNPIELAQKWREVDITPSNAFEKYQSLWGEQQARATQQRMNMTPAERQSEDWTKTLANNEGKYNEPIIKYGDGVAMSQDNNTFSFLKKAQERIQSKIDSGEIPEKGRTVISPYENGKQYYLGESGKVYFQRANGVWRETENFDTVKDVKYVAENGLSNFKKIRGEEDLRFEKALEESKLREARANETYKMSHTAPTKDNGVSANDINKMFPEDIYSPKGADYYGHGNKKMDQESINIIKSVRNKPDAEVTIYRAVPKDLDVKINPDDWVTTSKLYAHEHGKGPLKGNYKIIEMKVKAKDLYTDGNSIHEWGWSPNKSIDGMIAMSSPTLSGGMVGGITGATSDLDGDGKITYKDIAIGALGGAGLTKGVILARNTNAIINAKALIKKAADTDFVDAIIGHKIYQKTDYMNLREKMLTAKNKALDDFAQLHEQLKLLDDNTRKNMYKYMSGENVNLNGNIKTLADNYKNEINRLSQELVNLKVLDQAQADKFKDRYLHRRYEKDLSQKFNSLFKKGKTVNGVYARGNEWTGTKAEYDELVANGEIGDFFQGKIEATRMNNGQYKFRQDWTPEQRARWGEIEDIAFSLPETLMRSTEMVQHAKMLKDIVDNTRYVLDEATDGYVQLNGKKYGALQGKYVPKDMASDIDEFHNAIFGHEGGIFSKEVGDAFRALSTFWKKSHTVYNPIAHANNLVSNVTMQFGAGVNPNKAVQNAYKGALAAQKVKQFRELTAKELIGLSNEESTLLNALKQDDDLKLWIEAQRAGLFGRSGLNDILNQYINPRQVTSSRFSGLKKAWDKVDDVASAAYQGEDNIMRFSMLKSLTEQGKTLDEAMKIINNTIPDYTKPMSRLARFGRNSMLTPFISWTYYSTPIILKQFKERPERILAIYGALYGMNKLMGIDPFNEKDIPQQNFSMKRIPIYKDGNEVTTIKVDRWTPHNDMLNPLDLAKNLTSGGAWAAIPDLLRNRNSYFGGKITHNEGALKAYDLTKYGVQQINPDIIDNAWNLAETKLLSEKKRTKNPVIQPRTTTEELLKNFGINIMTYNKANQAKKIANEKIK